MIAESVGTLLGFGLVTASSVLNAANSVVLTVTGDEDPNGDEELAESEIFGQAPLIYRPKDPDSTGQMEVLFLRDGDDRVVIGTKDRRWQLAPAEKGDVILTALGEDGSARARITLGADGTAIVHGQQVVLAASEVLLGSVFANGNVAFKASVESALADMRSVFAAHVHPDPVSGNTSPPTTSMTDPGSLGSTKVKAE